MVALCAWRTTVLNWAPSLGHQLLRANHLVGTIPLLYYRCKTFPDCWRSYHCSIRRVTDWKEVVVVVAVVEWCFANDHVHSWLWTSSCCCWLMFCKSSCRFLIVKKKMLLLIDGLQFIMLIADCEEEAESSCSFVDKKPDWFGTRFLIKSASPICVESSCQRVVVIVHPTEEASIVMVKW